MSSSHNVIAPVFRITTSQIHTTCIMTVRCYINQFSRLKEIYIPHAMVDSILLMYAKPIIIKVIYENQIKYISFCIITDNWKSLETKTLKAFKMSPAEYILYRLYYSCGKGQKLYISKKNCIAQLGQHMKSTFTADIVAKGIIVRIDKGLEEYYQQHNRTDYINSDGMGKFRWFCEENAFEDEDAKEEFEISADMCTLVDFDVTEESTHLFPFENKIEDKCKQNEEIYRVLNYIKDHGKYEKQPPVARFDLSVFVNITQQDKDYATTKYKKQMKLLGCLFQKDCDVMYCLTVGYKCEYPVLMYIIDMYTQEKVKNYCEKHRILTVRHWCKENAFMKALRKKCKYGIGYKLESAMESFQYIIPTIRLTPTIKVKETLKDIYTYVALGAVYVVRLLRKLHVKPPFQVDLNIAMKGSKSVIFQYDSNNELSSDDDCEDTAYQRRSVDPRRDHIGVVDIYKESSNSKRLKQLSDEFIRMSRQTLGELQVELSTLNSEQKTDNINIESQVEEEKHSNNCYPQNRRMSIFVDRRENKSAEEHKDEITFFEPPDDCDTIEPNSVSEIQFELIRRCLLPKHDGNITSLNSLCGQLMTFMYTVNSQDEIRCYIIWNGQTTRIFGEYMKSILPHLFIESEENINFVRDTKQLENIQQLFNEAMTEKKYARFCKQINAYKDHWDY